MDVWNGLLVALMALFAIFALYLGGAAILLKLIDWLLPAKDAHDRDLTAPPSAS